MKTFVPITSLGINQIVELLFWFPAFPKPQAGSLLTLLIIVHGRLF